MKSFLVPPPAAVGILYSSVVVGPSSIARRALSSSTIDAVLNIVSRLSPDPYNNYLLEVYRRGLETCGADFVYADLLTVLHASAQIGQPRNYLEIGVRRGRSACVVAAGAPNVDLYAFDMWQPDYGNNANPGQSLVRAELAAFGHKGSLTFVEGNSHDTLPGFFRENASLQFDLVTVDGDHSPQGAWFDLVDVAPHVAVGGIIVFDDTANPYCPGLQGVWDRFVHSDTGLRSFSWAETGAGVSFAVRVHPGAPLRRTRRTRWLPRWA